MTVPADARVATLPRAEMEDFLASPMARFRPWVTPDGRSPQREFLRAAATHPQRVFRAGNRTGKLQPVTEPVLTPTGWRPIGELRVGDEVFDETGGATRVTGVFPQGRVPIFKVTFNDGAWTRCGEEHLWKVKDREARFRKALPTPTKPHERVDHPRLGRWSVMSLREIRERWGDRPRPVQRMSIPTCRPVQFPPSTVPLDPYVLGALIGDGCIIACVQLTSADAEVVDEVRRALPPGHTIRPVGARGIDWGISGVSGRHAGRNEVLLALRQLGLMGKRAWEKRVPPTYLVNDVAVRLGVLQGLMDTDGTVDTRGFVEFSTTSAGLADDVRFLVQSLGGKSRIRSRITSFNYKGVKKQGRRSYRVSALIHGITPFRLVRKATRYKDQVSRTYDRILTSIEPAGDAEAVCLQVASDHHTYLTRDFIVTHNTSVACWDVLARCLGWHPYARHRPPVLGWMVTLDWETGVGQIIWPKMREMIPMHRVRHVAFQRRSEPQIPTAIIFDNGSELHFKSAEARLDKFAGVKLHFAAMDEEQPSEIVEEVRARLVDVGGDLFATLTPVARKAWVRDLEREPTTKVIRASMRDAAAAGILPTEAVDRYLSSLPDRQRRVRELGEFAALEGLVYQDFQRDVHVVRPRGNVLVDGRGRTVAPWPLPATWPRAAAMDFGYSVPAAVVVIAEDPSTTRWIVERVLYAAQVRVTQWGKVLRETLPRLSTALITDWDAMERAELAELGIATSPAVKAVVAGIEAVERALFQDPNRGGDPHLVLVVDDVAPPHHPVVGRCDAHWLAWELESYRYPRRDGGRREDKPDARDVPMKKDDHACDALRYLVHALEKRRLGDPLGMPDAPDRKRPLDGVVPPKPAIWRSPR